MSRPRISVLIPAWNSRATLDEALESLARQSFRDWEAVLADDGSTDGTLELAREWERRDSRVRAVTHEGGEHRGTPATRNRTVREAGGQIAVFLDSDDVLEPGALERYRGAFSRFPEAGAVYGRAEVPGAEGAISTVGRGIPLRPVRAFAQLARFNVLVTSATAVRLEALGADPFPGDMPLSQDWAAWLGVARRRPFVFLPEVLARYRVHEGSATVRMERGGKQVEYEVAQARHLRSLFGRLDTGERRAADDGLEYRATLAFLQALSALGRGEPRLAARWARAAASMPSSPAGVARALARTVPERLRIRAGEDPPLSLEPTGETP